MLKIENSEVLGWEHAIRGMRNPMNSWEMSDSQFRAIHHEEVFPGVVYNDGYTYPITPPIIGPNDLDLMHRLRASGTDHRKFMRMIVVYLDITAPLYWWKEFDTYKVGTVANSCSTMHKIHAKEFSLDDFSNEHLMCFGSSDTDRREYENNIFNETVRELTVDPIGLLIATIKVLNNMRGLYLLNKDKQYWWQMIQLLPTSYNQKRTVLLNYEVLANIYKSRRNHKLVEWHILCDWIESLPHSELITGKGVHI